MLSTPADGILAKIGKRNRQHKEESAHEADCRFFACVLVLAVAVVAMPQTPAQQQAPTLVTEVQNTFNAIKGNITKSAEQFPEDKYTWQPTPQVRSWARLIAHISDDNNGACSVLIGEQRPARLDNETHPILPPTR